MTLAQPGAYAATRPYVVADSLDDLQGPDTGMIALPHAIDWHPDRTYDLDDLDDTRWMYSQVILEASAVEQLHSLLNRGRLILLWPTLALPSAVRRLWTARHTALADKNPR